MIVDDSSGFSWDPFLGDLLRDSGQILAGVPVNRLDVGGDFESVNRDVWEDVFRRYPELETLLLRCSGDLNPVWIALASMPDKRMYCPRLKRISGGERESQEAQFFTTTMIDTPRAREQEGLRLSEVDAELQEHDADGKLTLDEDIRECCIRALEDLVDRVSIMSIPQSIRSP
ncbi:hypothetical protein C8Q76DRAFT_803653 [Earliella scabrosa]|nr:hypothetical protein C8Q76DRAFT_803653 [Earliella scabrosa]